MKKLLGIILVLALVLSTFSACGSKPETGGTDGTTQEPTGFNYDHNLSVISREDGSGTRGAFIELFGIEQKNADGKKIDNTTEDADITNSTAVMMTSVEGDEFSIGYISLGSLGDTVKAVKIDETTASVDNIKNSTYKIARPFNIATNGTMNDAAQDFVNFIMSTEGQKVVEDNKYIGIGTPEVFSSNDASGKVVIAGSSSVTPVMEKLKEAFVAHNPNVEIEIQTSDSTTGMTSVLDGICDIGMASRELKDSEIEKGLVATVMAMDGIAVIVNKNCPVESLTSEQVMKIFTGEITTWLELK